MTRYAASSYRGSTTRNIAEASEYCENDCLSKPELRV